MDRSTVGTGVSRGLILALAIAIAGCDASPPASLDTDLVRDSAGIRIVEVASTSSPSVRALEVDSSWMEAFDLEVGRLGDVAPLPEGGAVILDEMRGTLAVLAQDGGLRTEFGGLGEGPGEFSPHGGISRILVDDSILLVPDIQLQRITGFSLEGEVVSSGPLPGFDPELGPVFGVDWRAHPEGGIAFRVLTPTGDLLVRADGEVLDTLHALSNPVLGPNRLLPPTPVWDVGDGGVLVVGRSDRSELELRDPGKAAPRWKARLAVEGGALTPDDEVHLEALLLDAAEAGGLDALPAAERDRILRSVTLPDSVPVLASVHVDPRGHIWVQGAAPVSRMGPEVLRVGSAAGFGGSAWWVLDGDGHLEERVRLPRGFTPRRFVGACLYGILEDELGVERPARVCTD